MWWQAFPGHTEYLAAEWLDRKENKKRKYLEALWLLLADDNVLWGYRHRTKAGFSYAMTRGWYETGDTDEGDSMVGARLAASLCIFSKAVKNNWSPAYGVANSR